MVMDRKTMISMTCDYSCKNVADFLTDYCGLLFSCGSTCIRLEKNTTRIAAAYGMQTEISVFPRHIHLSVHSSSGDTATAVISIHPRSVSFSIIAALSRLSWDIADEKLTLKNAETQLNKINNDRHINSWAEMLLVAIANAAFCRLFQGDITAMITAFASTIAGISTRHILAGFGLDSRCTVIVCATVSTVIAAADALFGIGSTPEIAEASAVLYLIPGIPLINALCDMLDAHYICAFGRMMHAIVITACLSLGFFLGMTIMNQSIF